jgi:hypothetical protein
VPARTPARSRTLFADRYLPARLALFPRLLLLQLIGLKAKIYAKKRHSEKITMKKTIAQHSERDNKHKAEDAPKGAVPHYLLDREQVCARAPQCGSGRHWQPPLPAAQCVRAALGCAWSRIRHTP